MLEKLFDIWSLFLKFKHKTTEKNPLHCHKVPISSLVVSILIQIFLLMGSLLCPLKPSDCVELKVWVFRTQWSITCWSPAFLWSRLHCFVLLCIPVAVGRFTVFQQCTAFSISTIYNFSLSGQHYSLGCSPDVGRARVWLLECSGNYHSRNPLHQRCTNNTLNATGKYKYIAICFSVSHRNTALRIAQPCFISINHSYCLMAKMTCCRILQQLAKITWIALYRVRNQTQCNSQFYPQSTLFCSRAS